MRLSRIARLVLLIFLAGSYLACQRAPLITASAPLPILAWYGPPAKEATSDRYQELVDAGFNINFSSFPNLESLQKAMDIAEPLGLKLMASCPELKTNPEETANQLKDHPALAGYYLRDEPSAELFDELGAWMRRIQSVDSAHPCYINLFPTYASAEQLGTVTYQEHVDQYIEKVPVPFVSFDHYPVVHDQLRPDWIRNLTIISDSAEKAGLPFWAFALSVGHDPYPTPTLISLRLQLFTDLAFGAKGIQFFTYWTPVSSTWNFHTAPIESDGTRTEVYDLVKKVTGELRGIWPVFDKGEVVDLGFVGEPIPDAGDEFTLTAPLAGIDPGEGAWLISLLDRPPYQVLAVINWNLAEPRSLRIDFDDRSRIHSWTKSGEPVALESSLYEELIDAGDIRLFLWESD